MGSPENEMGREDIEIQHSVTISYFWMCRNVVTQKEYSEIMGANPSITKGDGLPVDMATWYDTVEFCNKLVKGTTCSHII